MDGIDRKALGGIGLGSTALAQQPAARSLSSHRQHISIYSGYKNRVNAFC
jgi:hypothetical protein